MHIPVLLHEVIEGLALKPGLVVCDGTGGYGGHSKSIAEKITPGGTLLIMDQDPQAVSHLKQTFANASIRVIIEKANFRHTKNILQKHNLSTVDRALLDLGISSTQLDTPERGFSFLQSGPLDMRMDTEAVITLKNILSSRSERELTEIIRQYGEERFAGRIARAIKTNYDANTIHTTEDLARVIQEVVPGFYRHGRIHPATRTFQALRIIVNQELESLQKYLQDLPSFLKPQGRALIISFHSLEDRMVKHSFRQYKSADLGSILTKKPIEASEEEVAQNSRARSAKLRIFERNGNPIK